MDWPYWIARWERMQERYVPKRNERFELIIKIVERTQGQSCRILDLGCGPGSLMLALLERLPESHAWGVDMDPTLLLLAEHRLVPQGDKTRLICSDLRDPSWIQGIGPVDAVVSATALHWLSAPRLYELYGKVAHLLAPGGVFINADHVRSDDPRLQETWERDKDAHVHARRDQSDDWDGFWAAYLQELGQEYRQPREAALGPWEGNDAGLPLSWHMDSLATHGFVATDCFWRYGGNAIYGGFKQVGGQR